MKKFTLLITCFSILCTTMAQNNSPTVSNAIADQIAVMDVSYSYIVPDNTFEDLDNDPLIISASKPPVGLIDDTNLPTWLSFDVSTKTLTGIPLVNDVGSITIRITADDSNGGAIFDEFILEVITSAPTDITLTNNSIDENLPVNTQIGQFQSVDSGVNQTFSYSLVAGTGDTDNSAFNLNGAILQTSESFDFDIQSQYSIRIRSVNSVNGSFEKVFTINVIGNDPPTDILLSSNTIDENEPLNTSIGILSTTDPDTNESFTYSLVSGIGDEGNASFNVQGSILRSSAIFNFNSQNSYNIRLQTTDKKGNAFEKSFTINIIGNDPPTDISLTFNTIDEFEPINTSIGVLSTADPDTNESFTYSLVSGIGDEGNVSFNLQGAILRSSEIFDFDIQNSYNIRVQTIDKKGNTFEKSLTINIIGNDPPTDITITFNTVDENEPVNTSIGVFNSIDPDPSDFFTYSLVSGEGDQDNSSFNLTGTILRTAQVFNYDVQSSYSIRIRSTDKKNHFFEKSFVITVINNDPPSDLTLKNNLIAESQPAGTFIGIFITEDSDSGEVFTYSLVSGVGDTGNGVFSIQSNNQLVTNGPLVYATQSDYSIRVQTTDKKNHTLQKVFNVHVINPNNVEPVVDNPIANQVTTENQVFNFQFSSNVFSDQNGDQLTYSATLTGDYPLPSWLTFEPAIRTFSGTPTTAEIITIKVTANDGNAAKISDLFSLSILNANVAPIVADAIADQMVLEDEVFSYQLEENVFTDEDGDQLTYSALLSNDNNLPTWLSFNETNRTFNGTPTNDDVGTIVIKVTAEDGNDGSVHDEFNLEVVNTNDAPIVLNQISNQMAIEDLVFVFQFSETTFSDDDSDVLIYTASLSNDNILPSWLSFNSDARTFTGSPTNNEVGTINIKVTADDGNSGVVSDEFELEIVNTNDSPVVVNGLLNQQATEDLAFTFQFPDNTFSDQDGDQLNYSALLSDDNVLPSWITFDPDNRTLSGTPENGDVGIITIKVAANDGNNGLANEIFDLEIINTNDAPVSNGGLSNQQVVSGELLSYQFPESTFTDEDGDLLTYSAIVETTSTLPSWLTFEESIRTFSGTPNTDDGVISIVITADDGNGGTASDEFNLTVSSVITSLDIDEISNNVVAYPNPSDQFLTIQFQNSIGIDAIQMVGLDGSMVRKYNITQKSEFKMNVSDILPGIYLIELLGVNQRIHKRITIK